MISFVGCFAALGAPAPTMNMVFVTAGNELMPVGAFADQRTDPSLVDRA
ncbi:MAG TPA: hypothetical protein VFI01_00785 [Gaiellaceae bacterium]|nr:hypothetical protein [Gaiellaceae bacterium]